MRLSRLRPLMAALFASMLAFQASAAEPARRWTLATADTRLVVGVSADNKLCIYELASPAAWNCSASCCRTNVRAGAISCSKLSGVIRNLKI